MFSGKNSDFSKKSLNKNPKFPKINEINVVLLMSTKPIPKSFPSRLLYENHPLYVKARRDPVVFLQEHGELRRQIFGIEMIASENFPSEAVLAALSSPANNKYAEGYPGKRYYGGCEFVDLTEQTAIERARILFSARHANVQPHAGTQANQAAFLALMDPRDTILSMNLDQGGHLSHGSSVNQTGQIYKIVHYNVNSEGFIDYDQVRDVAKREKPRVIVAGGSAYSIIIDFQKFREITDEAGAYLVADIAHIAGLVAAGLHPSPIDLAHVTTTTTHKTLRGPRGGMILLGRDYDAVVHKESDSRYPMPLHRAIDSAVFPGIQGGPLQHVIGAKAVAFGEALNAEGTGVNTDFVEYQRQVIKNAAELARYLTEKGYSLSAGRTDNHLVLVRSPRGLTGLCAQYSTEAVGITTNKNKVPYDKETPQVTSGLRLGTPALTTRGIKEEGVLAIAEVLDEVLSSTTEGAKHKPEIPSEVVKRLKPRIEDICRQYPLYPDLLAMYDFIARDLNLQRV